MASIFYDQHVPDYGDLDNVTGLKPGFRFMIKENDGGIGIFMIPIYDNPDCETVYTAFFNMNEAKGVAIHLLRAIKRAESKTGRGLLHRSRVRDIVTYTGDGSDLI